MMVYKFYIRPSIFFSGDVHLHVYSREICMWEDSLIYVLIILNNDLKIKNALLKSDPDPISDL